jgi:hypothetical protein
MPKAAVRVLVALVAALGAACVGAAPEDPAGDRPTYEEFLASAYLEPWEHGVYIVNGDTPIENEKKLREFYDELYGGRLIVHRSGGADAKWNDTAKRNITYCVSNNFGNRKASVVSAMDAAAAAWEAAADVNFVYVSAQDGACTATNGAVVFDVRPVSGQPYLARAFFPNQGRSSRNVLIDSTAYTSSVSLTKILTHELGHALGFRHEHTRPESGQCFEDNAWRPLTTYDSASVMHYPQCGGTGPALTMSAKDRQGAAALYGAPGGGGGGGGGEPPGGGGGGGTPQQGSATGQLAQGQRHEYQAFSVVPGSRFVATIQGSGDADLYVRFGAMPTLAAFHCRPYLDGSLEQCDVDVPAGVTTTYVMVHGFRAAAYQLDVSWVQP